MSTPTYIISVVKKTKYQVIFCVEAISPPLRPEEYPPYFGLFWLTEALKTVENSSMFQLHEAIQPNNVRSLLYLSNSVELFMDAASYLIYSISQAQGYPDYNPENHQSYITVVCRYPVWISMIPELHSFESFAYIIDP
ncbi:MAG: hypothetical protein MUC87_20405 [Bacteroidia bacterium]|jgi:hypothetical protein|nr:hypothetical protein [Bacteroidia bacterium]